MLKRSEWSEDWKRAVQSVYPSAPRSPLRINIQHDCIFAVEASTRKTEVHPKSLSVLGLDRLISIISSRAVCRDGYYNTLIFISFDGLV